MVEKKLPLKYCPACGKPMKETETGWECIHDKEGVVVEI